MNPIDPIESEAAPQAALDIPAQQPFFSGPPPALLNAPKVDLMIPFDQTVRAILVFYLEQILHGAAAIKQNVTLNEIMAIQFNIRSARRVLNTMGEELDVTDLSPIPTDLRWLSRNTRPLIRWYYLVAQAEHFRSISAGKTGAADLLLQEWNAELLNGQNTLIDQLDGRRFARFNEALHRICQNDKAGIFAKKATRQKLYYVLPAMLWEQYQQLCVLEDTLNTPKRKRIRQISRQTRNLYHLLSHFKTVMGPSGARCIEQTFILESLFRNYEVLGLAVNQGRNMASTQADQELSDGLAAFIQARQVERNALIERLPGQFAAITSKKFRRDLGHAAVGP